MRALFACCAILLTTIIIAAPTAQVQGEQPHGSEATSVDQRLLGHYIGTAEDTTDGQRGRMAIDSSDAEVPARAEGQLQSLSDEDLWHAISQSDYQAVIGLKTPGRQRGVWKDQLLIDTKTLASGQSAVIRTGGVRVLAKDPVLPVIMAEIQSYSAFKKLRQLPHVDYIEPVRFPLELNESFGCQPVLWGTDPNKPVPFSLESMRLPLPLRDVLPWNFKYQKIPEAWARGVSGAGVTVAVVDTGVFLEQAQLHQPQFSSGMSGNRSVEHVGARDGNAVDSCSHGTRMAGTVAAPRDGGNITGVAWGANLVSIKAVNDVVILDGDQLVIAAALHTAVNKNAKIVAMALGTLFWHDFLADVISYYINSADLLIFAAAGTEACVDPIHSPFPSSVMFPARMEQVVAVTGILPSGARHPSACGGPEVDLAAVIGETPAPGRYPYEVIHFGGSSAATAVVAGVAALVWSKHPTWKAKDVRLHLERTTGRTVRDPQVGWGSVNAYAAVGGFDRLSVQGPLEVDANERYELIAVPYGEGPFTYRWLPGGETTRSIQKVAGANGTSQSWSVEVTDVREQKKLGASMTVKVRPLIDDDICLVRPWLCEPM